MKAYTSRGTAKRITESVVDGAADLLAAHGSPDELVVRDTELKGFVLRLRATGRHVYGVALRRGAFTTLGGSDTLTAGKARLKAREDLAQRDLSEDGTSDRARRKAASMTLGAFLTDHYEPWARAHLKTAPETLVRLRVNFADSLGSRIADLAPFAIERWRTARLKAGRAKSTVNRDVVALKAAISKAVTWGHLRSHPLAAVKPYRVDSGGVIRYLSPAEEKRLLTALLDRDTERRTARESANLWRRERGYTERDQMPAYTDHVTPLVTLALHTGLRRGELFGLRWRDVDLGRAMATVRGEGAKSGHTRHVPLNTTAVAALQAWLGDATPAGSALVFTGTDGEPLTDVKKAWANLVKRATLKDFRFHDLRHTFASKLVTAGVDLNTVRELLGHGDIKMTLRYAHLAPETKAAAVAKLVTA